jgi:hypothetical protein
MRKLTVKNFSVIKEAELDFGKITVLIGPQSSGKSLLCKLAFFLGQVVPEFVEECVMSNLPQGVLMHKINEEFQARFPESSWSGQQFKIEYTMESFTLLAEKYRPHEPPHFDFGTPFDNEYANWLNKGPKGLRVVVPSRIRKQIESQGVTLAGPPIIEDSVYIPTGRSFYSTPNRALAALSTKNVDWITQLYATVFDADYKALRESYETEQPVLYEFGQMATQVIKGRVIAESGRLVFESSEDSRRRPFEILSSGTQELLPLINSLSQLSRRARYPDIPTMPVPPFGMVYIEEPESSVFPTTQNDLVKLFAWLASQKSLWIEYAITTHSPYILSAFGNLLKAGKVGAQSAEHHAAVEKTIAEKYWIKISDFAAYKIENGVLKSIFDKDTGQIDGDYLDDVSSDIAEEFGQLLEIQYGG